MSRLISILLGCRHRNLTFPLTENRVTLDGKPMKHTYIACLSCGKEFTYDWRNMRVGRAA